MLTNIDVSFIDESRKEIRALRTKPITIFGSIVEGRHPITGEPVKEDIFEDMQAVITEISVRTSLDRYLDEGIEIRTGDIIVDISIDDMPENMTNDDITKVKYDDKDYKVLAADKLGLGGYNRIEIIGRLIK